MVLLVLAGGLGTRYGGQKQFDAIGPNGECLLEYTLFDALHAGFTEFVIVTNEQYKGMLDQRLRSQLPASVKLHIVIQSIHDVPFELNDVHREEPWGTAHAVWSARELISGVFATVNADDLYGRAGLSDAMALAQELENAPAHYGLVSYFLKHTTSPNGGVSRGVCEIRDGYLTKVVEHKHIERLPDGRLVDQNATTEFKDTALVSMNLWVLKPSIFTAIEGAMKEHQLSLLNDGQEIYLPAVIQELLASNETCVRNRTTTSEWVGLTFQQDRELVQQRINQLIKNGHYPPRLWN